MEIKHKNVQYQYCKWPKTLIKVLKVDNLIKYQTKANECYNVIGQTFKMQNFDIKQSKTAAYY